MAQGCERRYLEPGTTPREAGVDPTTFSVVWNRLESLLDECGEKVLHATQSYVLALVRDFGLSWLNPGGEIVAAAAYIARHIFTAAESARNMIQYFDGEFAPGDLIIGNDPYLVRSGHLPDWTFIRPVFYQGRLFGFFQFRGHMADTGGFLPGGYGPKAYDIIAEGLNIPPLKVIKGGVVDKDLWTLICRNVRNAKQVDMDTMLIDGALGQAENRVIQLIGKYGPGTVTACMQEIVAAGERAARAEIASMPDGTYHGESATDWDGTTDRPVWVRVDMTVFGDELTFDFTGSDPQVTFVNSPLGNTISIAMESFYAFIDPMAPKNQGSFVPVRVVAPEGTVVNPTYPATVGAGAISVGEPIMEACKIALAQALPERATGGFSRHACPINVGMVLDEIDPRTGSVKQYMAETFASDGSGGAMRGFDGWPGVGPGSFLGSFVRPDIEHFESEVPFRVMRYEFMTDAEGAGEYRGGPGVYVEMASDVKPGHPSFLMTGNCDGMVIPARGSTGEELARLEMWVETPDGCTRTLRTMANEAVYTGETVFTRSPGGGGWGDPLDRDPRRVCADVIDGLVTPERAREVYGVVVGPEGAAADELKLEEAATERLRKDCRETKG
jgi:N-methylhydantoinase B